MSNTGEINEKTRIPIKFVITICVAIIGGTTAWHSLETKLQEIQVDLRDLKRAQATRAEISEWSSDLQARNPMLRVPKFSARHSYESIEPAGSRRALKELE